MMDFFKAHEEHRLRMDKFDQELKAIMLGYMEAVETEYRKRYPKRKFFIEKAANESFHRAIAEEWTRKYAEKQRERDEYREKSEERLGNLAATAPMP